jgi:cysteine desulfuration protein SufE
MLNRDKDVEKLDEILDEFEFLDDWEQRYQYLAELGEQLPPMPEEYKVEKNKVKGCMSQVWLHAYRNNLNPDLIRYYGDCDTTIIKGVLAVLIRILSDQPLPEIEKLDVDDFFNRLNLDEHLSPNRHVGVYAIVELMKQQARNLQLTTN